MPVPVAVGAGKPQHHDVRPVAADHPHHVRKRTFPPPLLQRLIGGLREAEIDGAREELLAAVDAPRRQQFLCANQTQQLALLRSDEVLTALAACYGKVSGARVAAAGEPGEDGGVFVVRVGGDHEHASQNFEAFEGLLDGGRPHRPFLRSGWPEK